MLHFAKSKLQSFKNTRQKYKNIRKAVKFLKMLLWISFLYGRRKELNKNPYQPSPEKFPTPQWKEEGVLLHQQRAAVSHCCSRFQKSWEGQRIEKSHLVQPACQLYPSIHSSSAVLLHKAAQTCHATATDCGCTHYCLICDFLAEWKQKCTFADSPSPVRGRCTSWLCKLQQCSSGRRRRRTTPPVHFRKLPSKNEAMWCSGLGPGWKCAQSATVHFLEIDDFYPSTQLAV